MSRLPRGAARELRRMVEALDEVFLSRTLPDPGVPEEQPWWTRRM